MNESRKAIDDALAAAERGLVRSQADLAGLQDQLGSIERAVEAARSRVQQHIGAVMALRRLAAPPERQQQPREEQPNA
jgi:hypothetical protein